MCNNKNNMNLVLMLLSLHESFSIGIFSTVHRSFHVNDGCNKRQIHQCKVTQNLFSPSNDVFHDQNTKHCFVLVLAWTFPVRWQEILDICLLNQSSFPVPKNFSDKWLQIAKIMNKTVY
jgi:hypothetical protein